MFKILLIYMWLIIGEYEFFDESSSMDESVEKYETTIIPTKKKSLIEKRMRLDYTFTVALYNSQRPQIVCIGSIITSQWILDNCDDFYKYPYNKFKTGWISSKLNPFEYDVERRVRHFSYNRTDFSVKKFSAKFLFAAHNALLLHKSATAINFAREIARPIRLNQRPIVPRRGDGIIFSGHNRTNKKLRVITHRYCNDFFQSYFPKGGQIILNKAHICVDTRGINYNHCCNSQPILVSDNILVGIMAWSTGCSKEFGVDPWVFSNIGYYVPWIRENSDWHPFYLKFYARAEKLEFPYI